MKKSLFTISAIVMIVLSGCSSKKGIELPSEVKLKNNILSYYDKKDSIDENLKSQITFMERISVSALNDTENPMNVLVNEDGEIRSIIINSKDVTCFPNITIGDSKSKVEESFEYERLEGERYSVMFDGSTEVNLEDQNSEEDWLILNFSFDDNDKVSQIHILDVEFAKLMR